jgi:putative transposase
MDKFKNKYRIQSARLQNWDYRWNAAYFITICTKNREHFFGEILNDKIQLTPVGTIADVLWYEIKNHAINVELDAFVVMPNHIHGILILNGNRIENHNENDTETDIDTDTGTVETGHALSLRYPKPSPVSTDNHTNKTIGQQRFQNIGKNSVSSIIGSYKSAVSKHSNRLGFDFGWQTRFHDHIIRNKDEFYRIQQYIVKNPQNWQKDKFYK